MKKRIITLAMAFALALGTLFTTSFSSKTVMVKAADDYPQKYKNAVYNSLVDEWKFYNGQCTSFASWCLNSRNGVAFNNWYKGVRWGNAKNWISAARSVGITVDNTPAVGAIACFTEGTYGHVVWVSEVKGDTIVIEEYNYKTRGGYSTREIKASAPTGYIHIQDIVQDTSTQLIKDGWYVISTACDGSGQYVLNIAGYSKENGGNLIIYPWEGTDNEIFYVKYVGNGYYTIMGLGSGKYLHISDERFMYVNVHQWTGGEHDNALWYIEDAGNGYFYLRNKNNGAYLDLDCAIAEPDRNVQTYWFCGASSNAQKWRFIPYGEQEQTAQEQRYCTVTARSGLNMRKGAGTNYKKITAIPYGAEVEFLEEAGNGFYKVSYNGYTGYCSAQYLSFSR